ncbi:MAG: hypothetical protein OXG44_21345 [Gammaproteobacteria bacterium]|nr:hypothetical protein [Gammaproteobacteria bacterium]
MTRAIGQPAPSSVGSAGLLGSLLGERARCENGGHIDRESIEYGGNSDGAGMVRPMVNVPVPVECQHGDFRGTWIDDPVFG